MSTRTSLSPYPVIGTLQTAHGLIDSGVSGDMSAATITSVITILQTLTVGSYAYSWSGSSPSGTIQVLISNDYAVDSTGKTVINAGTWTPMYFTVNGTTTANTLTVSGNTGTGVVEWSTGCNALKTVYTKVSGTGTLSAVVKAKVA